MAGEHLVSLVTQPNQRLAGLCPVFCACFLSGHVWALQEEHFHQGLSRQILISVDLNRILTGKRKQRKRLLAEPFSLCFHSNFSVRTETEAPTHNGVVNQAGQMSHRIPAPGSPLPGISRPSGWCRTRSGSRYRRVYPRANQPTNTRRVVIRSIQRFQVEIRRRFGIVV